MRDLEASDLLLGDLTRQARTRPVNPNSLHISLLMMNLNLMLRCEITLCYFWCSSQLQFCLTSRSFGDTVCVLKSGNCHGNIIRELFKHVLMNDSFQYIVKVLETATLMHFTF